MFMSDFGQKFYVSSFGFEMKVMLICRWNCELFLLFFNFLEKFV